MIQFIKVSPLHRSLSLWSLGHQPSPISFNQHINQVHTSIHSQIKAQQLESVQLRGTEKIEMTELLKA